MSTITRGLLRVLADGVAAGIHTVATLERPGGVAHAALAALTQRWLFHVDDPIECAALGVRAAAVPPPVPGRVLLTDARLEAQLAVLPLPTARPAAAATRHRCRSARSAMTSTPGRSRRPPTVTGRRH